MKKTLFFAAGLIFALSLGSCEKDEYAPSAKRLLPSKIVATPEIPNSSNPFIYISAWLLEYDSKNRISELTYEYKSNDEATSTKVYTFSYDGDNITESKDGPLISTRQYIRKGSVIEIIADQQLLEWNIPIDNQLRSKIYSYDKNGNVNNYKFSTVKYDRRNGVFRYVNMPSWYLTDCLNGMVSVLNLYNNVIERLGDDGSGYGYSMEYNEYNYPVEIHRFPIESLGGGTVNYTIEYIEAK